MPAPVLLAPLIPLVIGAVFYAIGKTMAVSTRDWVRTTGVVVPNEPGTVLPGRKPSFAWRDATGVEHRRTALSAGGGFPPRIGSTVPIAYDPDNPAYGRIDTYGHSGRVYLLVAWLAIGLAVVAEVALLAAYVATR